MKDRRAILSLAIFAGILAPISSDLQFAPHEFVDQFMMKHDLSGAIMHLPLKEVSKVEIINYRKKFE